VENSVSDDIYLKKESCDITFDCANSVPVHLQLTTSQGYGLIGTSTGSVDFTAVSMCDPTLLNQLDQDFTKYFKLLNEFDLLDRVGSADVENEINKLKAKITAEQATIQSPEFVKLFDQMLASLSNKATLGEYKQLAQAREKLLSEPVKDWKTTDLDGKTHSLSDFKGNVVVLDFWYRGCGWCILAMPQIEAVAEHYANRPVTVIGMCTNNPDSGDGLFVAKKMGLTYPVYNAKEIATSYHIQGFPTTVIIDQTGAIRDVETGWKSDLRDTLLQKIDALLH
jgi:thiol-disulfide isomerase/thioredoxin